MKGNAHLQCKFKLVSKTLTECGVSFGVLIINIHLLLTEGFSNYVTVKNISYIYVSLLVT
jgi:hypothetical protein